MTIIEIKTGAPWEFDLVQLAAYMEMVKMNPSLECPGLERAEMENEEGETWHEYKRDGVTLPGVTTLLSLYRTYHFNDEKGKEAGDRGTWVHNLCWKYDLLLDKHRKKYIDWIQDDLPGEHLDGEFGKKCVLSYLKFLKDYKLEDNEVKNEVSLAGKGYAGTLDKIFMTPGKLNGYLLYLGKKYKVVPMSRRGYWMAFLNSALTVWQATGGKSRGFKQNKKNQEVKK